MLKLILEIQEDDVTALNMKDLAEALTQTANEMGYFDVRINLFD